MEDLTKNEIETVSKLLGKLQPGFLPYPVFVEVARLVVLPIIEMVPLRLNYKGQIEVLLLLREDNDPLWPGMLHTPGTVIRATDQENSTFQAFDRIVNDELKGTSVTKPYFVGSILHKSRRGMEQAQVYWVEVLEQPRVGEFYPINELPDNLIESQYKFITTAAEKFKPHRKSLMATRR